VLGGKNSPSGRCMMPGGKVKREGLLKRGMSVKRASVLMMTKVREVDQASLNYKRQEKVISLCCIAIQVAYEVVPSCFEDRGE